VRTLPDPKALLDPALRESAAGWLDAAFRAEASVLASEPRRCATRGPALAAFTIAFTIAKHCSTSLHGARRRRTRRLPRSLRRIEQRFGSGSVRHVYLDLTSSPA